MSGVIGIGEVVADIYRNESESPTEMPLTARPGGAPANVAVAAARLGASAGFVGSVGEDLFGDFILRALDSEGVDTSGVRRCEPPTRTSLAFVEIEDDGDRSFTFYRSDPAADELLSPEDITPEVLGEASFITFGSIPLIKDPSRSAIRAAAKLASESNVSVAFDVNLREHLWESLDAAREAVEPLLDLSTILKMGHDELEPLLGTGDVDEAATALLERGVPVVLVSLGVEGAFYATPEFRGYVEAFEVESVDATGAGDAFLAGALAHLDGTSLDSWDEDCLREATRRGSAAGALACLDYGAMQALPAKEELEKFMSGD